MSRPGASERYYVLFRSSFRYEAAPNISHETIDKVRTLCGRKVSDAATFEPDSNDLEADCNICRRASKRLRKQAQPTIEESPLLCEACSPGHRPSELRKPCGTTGCECWCNR